MNKKETLKLFSLISNVYDQFDFTEEKVVLWCELLKDQDPQSVFRKARDHFYTETFPPSVAQLREQNALYANNGARNKNVVALLEAQKEGATGEIPFEKMPEFIKQRRK